MEGSHCKCVEPLGESWFDVDIIIQLCKAMGIPWSADPDDPWPDSIKELDAACEPMGLTWEEWKQEFQKTGFRDCKKEYPDDWALTDATKRATAAPMASRACRRPRSSRRYGRPSSRRTI